MVKGKRFRDFRDTGDPVSAAKVYNHQDADELVFIDIEATKSGNKDRSALYTLLERVSEECFMPLTIGGGVDSVEDIRNLLAAGADKVLINTAAVETPSLIRQASEEFGAQCVVVCVDVKKEGNNYTVHTHSGTVPRPDIDLVDHLENMEEMGAGEIVANSIDRDGTMEGYDLDLLAVAASAVSIPVVALGGAGGFDHLLEALQKAGVHAVACASLFHFGDNNPLRAKAYLKNHGVAVKKI